MTRRVCLLLAGAWLAAISSPPASAEELPFEFDDSSLLEQAAPITADELEELTTRLLESLRRIRGLEAQRPVVKELVSQQGSQAAIARMIREDNPEETINRQAKALVKLGLLPPDLDVAASATQLYARQAVGFYDAHTQVLYVADWLPAMMQEGILAHELVHALQDQRIPLLDWLEQGPGDDDGVLARQAIMEGEATALMIETALEGSGMAFEDLHDMDADAMTRMATQTLDADAQTASMPPYLNALMLFPYVDGLGFFKTMRAGHTWSFMSQVYAHPPESTEQIIHPSAYLARVDHPTPVALPKLEGVVGPGWTLLDENVLGEFTWRTLFHVRLGEGNAEASTGWDGDRYQLFESSDGARHLLVIRTVWDSPADAQEFAQAYRRVIEGKYQHAQPVESPSGSRWWRTEADDVLLQVRGEEVWISEGAPPALTVSLMETMRRAPALHPTDFR
ncbi:MAG: hypothetical protein HYY15_00140 [Candidatus Omnitrophica bacterium]|nr:hypothetical protein [Candidatus Omnitrophota bacterium]